VEQEAMSQPPWAPGGPLFPGTPWPPGFPGSPGGPRDPTPSWPRGPWTPGRTESGQTTSTLTTRLGILVVLVLVGRREGSLPAQPLSRGSAVGSDSGGPEHGGTGM
jgi:hypothetical protein